MKTFGQYLREQLEGDSLISYLAKDFDDAGLLSDTLSPIEALAVIRKQENGQEQLRALQEAFKGFEATQPHSDS